MTYEFNEQNYKKFLKTHCCSSTKELTGLAKLFYFLDLFFRFAGIGFAIGLALHMFINKDISTLNWVLIFAVPITTLILATLLRKIWYLQPSFPYSERYKRELSIEKDRIRFAYASDGLAGEFYDTYEIALDKIESVKYNKKSKLLTIYGDIEHFWVLNGNASLKECKDVSFFNCYNEDIFKILKKKCSKECAFETN